MTLATYDFEQGTDEWHEARRGVLTASVIGQLITPKTLNLSGNDTARALVNQLVAEQITGYTEPTYVSADMERGTMDEPVARAVYSEHIAAVTECGFMVLSERELEVGYSPDGLVGDEGLIEIKSRRQKKQLETILTDRVPPENMAQLQCGLFVSGREWIDYVSYCGGMPLFTKRVLPDQTWQSALREAAVWFAECVAGMIPAYQTATIGLPETERGIDLYEEMRL